MTVEIKIGAPVAAPDYQNTFELIIGYMHGDADADSEKEFHYTDVEDLKRDLETLTKIDDFDEDTLIDYFTALGMDEDDAQDAASEFSDNFREGDCTTDYSNDAAIQKIELFWYDDRSVKHDVSYTVE